MILFQEQFLPPEQVMISFEDRGYQFGDGVYEVVRVYNGKPFYLDAHLFRLKNSANNIRLDLPYSIATIKDNCLRLIELNNLQEGIIYLQITRGSAPRNHAFPTSPQPVLTAYTKPLKRPMPIINHGASAITVADIRWLRCDIKSINLLPNVLAKQEAFDAKAHEAILHRNDIVTEGSVTNVFIVKNDILYTHPLSHLILNGITRQIVFDLAEQYAIPLEERPFTVTELLNADEIFITGTTSEITPIVEVDKKLIHGGSVGQTTKLLQIAYEDIIFERTKIV